MSYAIVRVLPTVIAREIDSILPTYPPEPYQRVFAISEVKQQLIDYVLKQVLGQASIDRARAGKIESDRQDLDVQLDRVRLLVHLGLAEVLQDNSSHCQFARIGNYRYSDEPSRWFG
ncbi:hypothetical protein [Synechococcus sp. PCC 7336]|uniref:hypothetical protein n=1 Tax=Synechococcus sp. PCC 7336 TaxID=195250 RepID=UPI000570B155|nr:hypothetical protein [Synechococcus sp. PCC 7336]